MADRFVSRVSVSLAAGASTTAAHNIVVGGAATAPQVVQPDRTTTIQVDSADATLLYLSNPGTSDAVAVFRSEYTHSIQGTPADIAPGFLWKGGGYAAAGSPAPIYIVDDSITDSAAMAAQKIYSAINLVIAAAEAASETSIVIYLLPPTQAARHAWAGASSGYAVASALSVTFQAADRLSTQISLSGAFPAAGPSFPYVTLCEVGVLVTAPVTGLFTTRPFNGYGLSWNGASQAVDFTGGAGTIYDADFFRPVFTGGFWSLTDVTVTQAVGAASFALVDGFYWYVGSGFVGAAGPFGLVTPVGGGPIDIAVSNVSLDVTVSGAYAVFDCGAGNFYAQGVDFCKQIASNPATLYNATAVVQNPVGVTTFPAPATQNDAAPATTVLVTVPADVRLRHVFGDVTLTPAVAQAALWTIEVETGIGTGAYAVVAVPTAPAAGDPNQVQSYSFSVPGGRRYRFTKGNGAGTTETISHYSFTD